MQRYLTPLWIAGHLLVLLVAAVFIRLGIWQLDRLEERRSFNSIVAERLAAPPSDLSRLLTEPSDELEYRQTFVEGTFDVSEEILVRSRTNNGEAGFHVVTPLVQADGSTAVLINRGWVPLELDTPPVSPALPPTGRVRLTGTVRDSQSAPALGPRDPAEGSLERVYWIDIPRIQQQSSYVLAPVSVELADQMPVQPGSLPVPVAPPELTAGSHLAYAIQWFAFALIGLGGYAALLRRSRKTGGVGESTRPVG